MMCVQTVLYIVIMLMGAQPIGNAIGQIVGVIVVNGWMACNVSSYSKKEAEWWRRRGCQGGWRSPDCRYLNSAVH